MGELGCRFRARRENLQKRGRGRADTRAQALLPALPSRGPITNTRAGESTHARPRGS